jgi:predicted secreted protein
MDNKEFLVYGGDMMLFVIPTSGTTKQAIAFSTSAKLSVSSKARDVSSKDSGDWTAKEYGKFDWNMSTDQLANFVSTGTTMSCDDLYQIYVSKQKVSVAFASKTGTSPSWTVDATKKSFTGTALITSFDLNAQDGETATYTISLDGDGPLVLA